MGTDVCRTVHFFWWILTGGGGGSSGWNNWINGHDGVREGETFFQTKKKGEMRVTVRSLTAGCVSHGRDVSRNEAHRIIMKPTILYATSRTSPPFCAFKPYTIACGYNNQIREQTFFFFSPPIFSSGRLCSKSKKDFIWIEILPAGRGCCNLTCCWLNFNCCWRPDELPYDRRD